MISQELMHALREPPQHPDDGEGGGTGGATHDAWHFVFVSPMLLSTHVPCCCWHAYSTSPGVGVHTGSGVAGPVHVCWQTWSCAPPDATAMHSFVVVLHA